MVYQVGTQPVSIVEAAALFKKNAHRICVVAHINPDGDAIGSGLAVVRLAHALGKDAWLSFSSPKHVPITLQFLPGVDDIIPPQEIPDDVDFVVVVDCGSVDRMGQLATLSKKVPYTLVIDHHRSNHGFGTHTVIRPTADATAQIVMDFADALEIPLDVQMAECLYTAIVTDTGCFRWGGVRAHEDAARLLAYGLDGGAITRRLLDTHSFAYLKFKSRILESTHLDKNVCAGKGLVWASISYSEYQRCRPEDATALIDELRTVEEAEVAIVFREMVQGEWTASLRSHDEINVADVAAHFGGGGHRRAAGFTTQETLSDIVSTVRDLLNDPSFYREG